MRRIPILAFLAVLTACGPTVVDVPADAPRLTAEPKTRIDARVALNLENFRNSKVYRDYKVWNFMQADERRVVLASYHVSAASRSVLTQAFERIFTKVEVMTAPIKPGDVDLIVVPKSNSFKVQNSRAVRGSVESVVSYDVTLLDSSGKSFGSDIFVGGITTDEPGGDMSRFERAVVRAMEDAGNAIIREFPTSKPVAAWRAAMKKSSAAAEPAVRQATAGR